MSKAKRKERRAKNKAKRQERRNKRKDKLEELVAKVSAVPSMPENDPPYAEAFKDYWPTVRSVLDYVKFAKITGKKIDAKIQTVIELGDDINTDSDTSAFRDKIEGVWKPARNILLGITVLNKDDKRDDQIDKMIEIGDYISGYDG
jgi:hypothetical protein